MRRTVQVKARSVGVACANNRVWVQFSAFTCVQLRALRLDASMVSNDHNYFVFEDLLHDVTRARFSNRICVDFSSKGHARVLPRRVGRDELCRQQPETIRAFHAGQYHQLLPITRHSSSITHHPSYLPPQPHHYSSLLVIVVIFTQMGQKIGGIFPPCGVVPFRGLVLYVTPLCFLFDALEDLYVTCLPHSQFNF